VQSCHAVAEAARHFLPPDHDHPHLIVCGVRDEPALVHAARRLTALGVRFRLFLEPDAGGRATALATEPVCGPARRAFRRYQLLKPPSQAPA
jgi:hypothetical protein